MRRVRISFALMLGAGLALAPAAGAKPKLGVFATINGKKFKAATTTNPNDLCVNGTYMSSGGVVFAALECHGGKHRSGRRNPKLVSLACGIVVADPNTPPPTPPFEAPCVAAGYTEFRTRHGVPVSMKEWTQTLMLEPGPDGNLVSSSSVKIRIDSFDGTYVRGAFYGVFDQPLQGGTPTQVAIKGDGTFAFAVKGVAP